MAKIIAKNVVQRKPGFLYYVDAQGNVCEAPMSRKGRTKKPAKKVAKKVTTKKKAVAVKKK